MSLRDGISWGDLNQQQKHRKKTQKQTGTESQGSIFTTGS